MQSRYCSETIAWSTWPAHRHWFCHGLESDWEQLGRSFLHRRTCGALWRVCYIQTCFCDQLTFVDRNSLKLVGSFEGHRSEMFVEDGFGIKQESETVDDILGIDMGDTDVKNTSTWLVMCICDVPNYGLQTSASSIWWHRWAMWICSRMSSDEKSRVWTVKVHW